MSASRPADPGDQITDAWRRHGPYLINLAYQIVGDIGDAEDVAQEAFLRLSRTPDPAEIDDIRGWLTVVVGRLSLDQVRSGRARYERPGDIHPDVAQSNHLDPVDRVTLDDEVSRALLQVMRHLSPGERVAFVLHDVFQVPFDAIAETVGRPAGTCRQLARRARMKFQASQPDRNDVTNAEHTLVTERFITACANGDVHALAAVLDPAVWGAATIIGGSATASRVNHGPYDVATNLLRFFGMGATLVTGPAGQHMLLAFAGRQLYAVIVLTISSGLVMKVDATADKEVWSAKPSQKPYPRATQSKDAL